MAEDHTRIAEDAALREQVQTEGYDSIVIVRVHDSGNVTALRSGDLPLHLDIETRRLDGAFATEVLLLIKKK